MLPPGFKNSNFAKIAAPFSGEIRPRWTIGVFPTNSIVSAAVRRKASRLAGDFRLVAFVVFVALINRPLANCSVYQGKDEC